MEKFDLEKFPTSESAKKMLGYVSDGFYDNSYVGKWIFQVMGIEYDKAMEKAMELPDQLFPETATWGLMYHEIKWGLPVRPNLPYEERRRLIYLKRDYRAPMTPYRMEKYLEDAMDFEVHIADVNDPGAYGFIPPHPNVFKVYFLGEGSLDAKRVREILDRIKQSHTTYKINDRIESELDNRDLEQIILQNIKFRIGIPFWYDYVYDGSWLLDGSVSLDMKSSYGLVLAFIIKKVKIYETEIIRLAALKFAAWARIINFINFRECYRLGINFWGIKSFDGSWNLNGSITLNESAKYCLSLGINQMLRVKGNFEGIRLELALKWKQFLRETALVKATHGFIAVHNCMAKAKITLFSEFDMSEREKVANVTLETRTKDYWFLDGSLLLDGTKNLNSVYRKEKIE